MATKTVTTRELGDLAGLQRAVLGALLRQSDDTLHDPLAKGLEDLEAAALVRVGAPVKLDRHLPTSLLGDLACSLANQSTEYARALATWKAQARQVDLNDVLRIAYNFSSEAAKLIRLLVSVADLKPILSWMTLGAHVKLEKSFRALPWLHTNAKATLDGYHSIISTARSRAFHNVFEFNRTLDVDVDGMSFRATKLRLALLYGTAQKGRDEAFGFEDQDLVRLLRESFTRSRQRNVEVAFLEANQQVMDDTKALVDSTASALSLLARTR